MRIATTASGTTITIEDDSVYMDNPGSSDDMRHREIGRIVGIEGRYGFQPEPFAAWGIGPSSLRALAQLIDEEAAA